METGGNMGINFKRFYFCGFATFLVSATSIFVGLWISAKRLEASNAESAGQFSYLKSLIDSYYSEHGSFPPTRFQRNPGEPFHSWRVLLLQYAKSDWVAAHAKFDYSKEWNSDSNVAALGRLSPIFLRMEADSSRYAQYIALGEGDIWPSKYGLKTHVIKRNGEAFILIEYKDSEVIWSSPSY